MMMLMLMMTTKPTTTTMMMTTKTTTTNRFLLQIRRVSLQHRGPFHHVGDGRHGHQLRQDWPTHPGQRGHLVPLGPSAHWSQDHQHDLQGHQVSPARIAALLPPKGVRLLEWSGGKSGEADRRRRRRHLLGHQRRTDEPTESTEAELIGDIIALRRPIELII